MSTDNIGGIVGPILGLAIAGYAVKTIGDMMHAKCNHCGHTIKARSHNQLKVKAAKHKQMHPQGNMWF